MFKPIITGILLFALLSAIACGTKCRGYAGIECPNNWTCCGSVASDFIGCFKAQNAVCCSDSFRACPSGFRCTPNGGCAASSLAFLAGPDTAAQDELVNGFLTGLGLFENLQYKESCDLNTDPQLVADINTLIVLVRNLKFDSSLPSEIMQLFKAVGDLIPRLQNIYVGCEELSLEIQEVMNRLVNYFQSASYIPSLLSHTIMHLNDLTQTLKNANAAYKNAEFNVAGVGFGTFVRTGLFWDFQA